MPAPRWLAAGARAVCLFVNDVPRMPPPWPSSPGLGVRHVALRCAGFNHVDLAAAASLGLDVVRVPSYSPNAIAEHTLALILGLDRQHAQGLEPGA